MFHAKCKVRAKTDKRRGEKRRFASASFSSPLREDVRPVSPGTVLLLLSIPVFLILIPALPLAAAVVTALLGPARAPRPEPLAGGRGRGRLVRGQRAVGLRRPARCRVAVPDRRRCWTWAAVGLTSRRPRSRPLEPRCPMRSASSTGRPYARPAGDRATALRSTSSCGPIRSRPSCWPRSRSSACWWPSIRSATCTATRAIGDSSPTSALFVFSMTMLVSVSNFRAALCLLGGGRPVQLPARSASGSRSPRRPRPAEGVSGHPRGRFRFRSGHIPALDDLRHVGLP